MSLMNSDSGVIEQENQQSASASEMMCNVSLMLMTASNVLFYNASLYQMNAVCWSLSVHFAWPVSCLP